jgi:hypothetical protein
MKTVTKFIYFGFASLALACFTLSPMVRAVVPAPDGGHANFTTAKGTNALLNLTRGAGNTAVGWVCPLFSRWRQLQYRCGHWRAGPKHG